MSAVSLPGLAGRPAFDDSPSANERTNVSGIARRGWTRPAPIRTGFHTIKFRAPLPDSVIGERSDGAFWRPTRVERRGAWWLEIRPKTIWGERSSEDLGRLFAPGEVAGLAGQFVREVRGGWSVRLNPDELRVCRIDPAMDVLLEASEGRALLTALQRAQLPRLERCASWGPDGTPLGAWWQAPSGGVVARAYDHGLERAYAAPGTVLRLEVQQRTTGHAAIPIHYLSATAAPARLHGFWLRRFGHLLTTDLELLPHSDLVQRLAKMAASGRVTASEVIRLLGVAGLDGHLAAAFSDNELRSLRRHRSRLHSLGLGLSAGVPQKLALRSLLEERGGTGADVWSRKAGDADTGSPAHAALRT